MLLCRRYVDNLKLPISNTFPKEVVVNINELTVTSCHRVIRQLYRPLVILTDPGRPNVGPGKYNFRHIAWKSFRGTPWPSLRTLPR